MKQYGSERTQSCAAVRLKQINRVLHVDFNVEKKQIDFRNKAIKQHRTWREIRKTFKKKISTLREKKKTLNKYNTAWITVVCR